MTTFKNRIKICSSLNAFVLMIDTEFENAFIRENFVGKYWLGALRYPESHNFMKINKSEYVRFTNWRKGEPNNYLQNEYCIETEKGEWNDLSCYEKRFGICEKPIGIGVTVWTEWRISNC
ncbi:hepatic lectin-like protein [Leptotrombidium deliense]|uniref:Hepatic lectin-like protein n=1 Tax=Leptotrombidium deliense TaxID=299467 RepID=A0A443RX60_9ACAR|nr:hepatic lectin-like protein [Leptotrombidium deliense]